MIFKSDKLTVKPKIYPGILPENPYKGWVVWGKSPEFENYSQPFSMIYACINWAEVEPRRNEFLWDLFEDQWNLKHAKGNITVVLRLVLDSPDGHLAGMDRDIPLWLYDRLENTKKGIHYNSPDIGKGYSPDYSNPLLIEEHERFIHALAEKYDADPRISFIQLGSLGHWGEWHTWPAGTGLFPEYKIAQKYITHYHQAFKQTKLLFRRPLQFHMFHKAIGLFNDIIGDNSTWGTPLWLQWIKEGYVSEWDKMKHPAMKQNWWHEACSAGELAWHTKGIAHWFEDGIFPQTLKHITDSHTSWIGPSGPGKIKEPDLYQKKIDIMHKTMGYRFVLKEVTYDKKCSHSFHITIVIENLGIAPIYYSWPFVVSLLNRSGEVMFESEINSIDIRKWYPGVHTCKAAISISRNIQKSIYELALSIRNPHSYNKHVIDFANNRKIRNEDGRFIIGPISYF